MWINTNTKEIVKSPKQITVGGVTYPSTVWKNKELLVSLGFKPFREVGVDSKYYWQGTHTDTETDTEVVRTYEAIPRQVQDKLEFNEDGTPMLDSEGNQVVTKGLVSGMIAQVKAKAGNDILAKYPEYKQRNYLAMYNNLLEKKLDGTITDEEASSMALLKSIWADIQAIREASNAKEQELLALTTIEEVIAYEQTI